MRLEAEGLCLRRGNLCSAEDRLEVRRVLPPTPTCPARPVVRCRRGESRVGARIRGRLFRPMTDSIPWDALFDAARTIRDRAHAPYSKFHVGAAGLFVTPSGETAIVTGCNVENSSYGLSVCAERNAIGRAVAEGRGRLAAMAIVVDTREPCPPCGMCRQVMAEFADASLPVRSQTLKGGKEASYSLGELLPHSFSKDFF